MKRLAGLVLCLVSAVAWGQDAPVPQPPEPPEPPHGQVLFSREHPPAEAGQQTSSSSQEQEPGPPDEQPKVPVTDAERAGLRIDRYDLELHLIPAASREVVQATLRVRNAGVGPTSRLVLQLSSTLRYQAVSALTGGRLQPVGFTQSPIATDADHTGYAQEVVITLPAPLAAGAAIELSVLYAGTVAQSSARLDLLGVAPERAAATDWDQIAPTSDAGATALRGFGNVLWYPVAAPVALLGDANRLFQLTGQQKLRGQDATVRLRLTIEYAGDPPEGAIFDGELKPLDKLPDDSDELVADTHGVATVEFPRRPLGFRFPSLFLTAQKPVMAADEALSVLTANPEVIAPYAAAAERVRPLLGDWFGVTPIRPLVLLDHPGEPFDDAALLVGQLAANAQPDRTAALMAGPLTHAWIRSAHPWIADGLARFMGLLLIEREHGRAAAVAAMAEGDSTLALAEPDLSKLAPGEAPAGEPLLAASSPIFFSIKASTVWWQLREILGEEVLRHAMVAYRHAAAANPAFDADPQAMQSTLERVSGKELGWFFADWVDHDRGLPDLTIVQVNSRPLPSRPGKNAGSLVAVEVRNAGDAVAEVPVQVSSGSFTTTERLRIPARQTASVRILFEGVPERVQVNDGSVPELVQTVHTFAVHSLEVPPDS